jgi:hypothetical protein
MNEIHSIKTEVHSKKFCAVLSSWNFSNELLLIVVWPKPQNKTSNVVRSGTKRSSRTNTVARSQKLPAHSLPVSRVGRSSTRPKERRVSIPFVRVKVTRMTPPNGPVTQWRPLRMPALFKGSLWTIGRRHYVVSIIFLKHGFLRFWKCPSLRLLIFPSLRLIKQILIFLFDYSNWLWKEFLLQPKHGCLPTFLQTAKAPTGRHRCPTRPRMSV